MATSPMSARTLSCGIAECAYHGLAASPPRGNDVEAAQHDAHVAGMTDGRHIPRNAARGRRARWTVPQDWSQLPRRRARRLGHAVRAPDRAAAGPRLRRLSRGLDVRHLSKPAFPTSPSCPIVSRNSPAGRSSRCPASCPTRCSSTISPIAASSPATSSAAPTSSIIFRSRTSSTTCSAMCRCSPIRSTPTICRPMAKAACAAFSFGAHPQARAALLVHVEFGLIEEAGRLKLFGASIVSSHGEAGFALDDPAPNRIAFDLKASCAPSIGSTITGKATS